MKKTLNVIIIVSFLVMLVLPSLAWGKGAPLPESARAGLKESVQDTNIQQHNNIAGLVGLLIKIVLGLLAIVFIILIIYAGFLWMTSHGESDKITKAKQIIISSIIGIIIILSAYVITDFVISKMIDVTSNAR